MKLTDKEQRHVRAMIQSVLHRVGGWPLAEALGMTNAALASITSGRRTVTPQLAIRVATLVNVSLEGLLAHRWLSSQACPRCGHAHTNVMHSQGCLIGAILLAADGSRYLRRSDAEVALVLTKAAARSGAKS